MGVSALNKASFLNKIFFYSENVFVLKKCWKSNPFFPTVKYISPVYVLSLDVEIILFFITIREEYAGNKDLVSLPARTGGDRGSSALLRLVVGPWVDSPGDFASKIDQRFNL